MNRLRIFVLFLLIAVTGCSRHVPTATVELIDTSLSITPHAEAAALNAVKSQIASLRRGDALILIPITGDAENDTGGHILRLQVPTTREPYDADLQRFRGNAQEQFSVWVATVHAGPNRTDILGALDAARQELSTLPRGSIRRLIVVSDFIEDDGTYRFTSDPSLVSPTRARVLALRLRTKHRFALPGVILCLGRVESSDFAPLSLGRKNAIQTFWATYLTENGRSSEILIDGAGMLEDSGQECVASK
jgi:hypothetical protein